MQLKGRQKVKIFLNMIKKGFYCQFH